MTKPFENAPEPRFDNPFIFDQTRNLFVPGADVFAYGIYGAATPGEIIPTDEYWGVALTDPVYLWPSAAEFGGDTKITMLTYRSPYGPSALVNITTMNIDGTSPQNSLSASAVPPGTPVYGPTFSCSAGIYATRGYGGVWSLLKKIGSVFIDVTPAFSNQVWFEVRGHTETGDALVWTYNTDSEPTVFKINSDGSYTILGDFAWYYGSTVLGSSRPAINGDYVWSGGSSGVSLRIFDGTSYVSDGLSYSGTPYLGTVFDRDIFERQDKDSGKLYVFRKPAASGTTTVWAYTPGVTTPAEVGTIDTSTWKLYNLMNRGAAAQQFPFILLASNNGNPNIPYKVYSYSEGGTYTEIDTVPLPEYQGSTPVSPPYYILPEPSENYNQYIAHSVNTNEAAIVYGDASTRRYTALQVK